MSDERWSAPTGQEAPPGAPRPDAGPGVRGDGQAREAAGGYPAQSGTRSFGPGPVGATTTQLVRRGPRRARLAVKHVDPWSVLKFTFVYSLALMVVGLVAVFALYFVLDAMGVFDAVNSFVRDINGSDSAVSSYFSLTRALGATALVGAINVVLFTALATLGAFLYNLCADLVGGIEITLAERD